MQQNRLKSAAISAFICVALTSITLLGIAYPQMYPRDLEGLEIFLGVSIVLSVYFVFAYYLQEWVESRMEYYWFWRTSSVLLCLAIAGGLLYVMFSTAGFWLPHFRQANDVGSPNANTGAAFRAFVLQSARQS